MPGGQKAFSGTAMVHASESLDPLDPLDRRQECGWPESPVLFEKPAPSRIGLSVMQVTDLDAVTGSMAFFYLHLPGCTVRLTSFLERGYSGARRFPTSFSHEVQTSNPFPPSPIPQQHSSICATGHSQICTAQSKQASMQLTKHCT